MIKELIKVSAVLSVLLWLGLAPVGAETPQQYDAALAQVQRAIDRQQTALEAGVISPGPSPSLVAQQALGPIHSVSLPGRAPILVNPAPLIAAVAAAEAGKDPEAKTSALDALSGQIALLRQSLQPSSSAAPAVSEAESSARAVLARPEFAADPPPPPSLADKIAAWLDKLFQPRRPAPASRPVSINPAIIKGILIAIAIAAFALLVWILVQAVGRRDARVRPLALDETETVLVEARDNNSLLALAEQQAKNGDYRRAFRLVYLAALVSLDTDGVLRFDRSKTNWEYLRALRGSGRSDLYAAMTPLTREFDQVWYGLAPANAAQYAWARTQYDALLAPPAPASPEAAAHA